MDRITIKDYLNVGDSIQVFTSNGKTISGKFLEEDPLFLTIQTENKESPEDVVMVFKPYVESYCFKKLKKINKSKKKEEPKWTH